MFISRRDAEAQSSLRLCVSHLRNLPQFHLNRFAQLDYGVVALIRRPAIDHLRGADRLRAAGLVDVAADYQ